MISNFIDKHYKHFNAATLRDAAIAYKEHIESGKKMVMTLAGAMSTAELGISLASMIREEKVHAISCTGANLEEDFYHLVSCDSYKRIPNWRQITPQEDQKLLDDHYNRVTDTCIPEAEAIRLIEGEILKLWKSYSPHSYLTPSRLPHEYFYELITSKCLENKYQKDPATSWLHEAALRDLPLFVPGWEDSTTGNIFASHVYSGEVDVNAVKGGIHYMLKALNWYKTSTLEQGVKWGMFQIGGGLAGDFLICTIPCLKQDLGIDVPVLDYFCQISDSTTSYGSYSGATPSEKISWGKCSPETKGFIIESDATIVAPLIFEYVLGN